MFEIICTHPLFIIGVVLVSTYVGKYLWASKDDKNTVEKAFTSEIHQLELNLAEKFGNVGEKIRIVQKEILDEADDKYLSKEIGLRHDARIAKLEQMMLEISPRLVKIDTLYDFMNKQCDK